MTGPTLWRDVMQFSELFKDIMIEKDTNVQKLSKNTGIDDSVLYDYLYGALPDVKYAVVLANALDCSLNYLMGLDTDPKAVEFKNSYDISLFSDRYDNLLKENKVSHYKLCKEKGLNYSSHYAWKRGSIPNMHSLIIIATYFDVSIDYLVGREK